MLERKASRRAERWARRGAPWLCAALLAPAAMAQPPAADGAPPAAVTVKPAAEAVATKLLELRAEMRPVTIQLPGDSLSGYDPAQVRGAAETAKRELLAQLGTDQLAALRAYVEASYPDASESLEVLSLRDGQRLATRESTEGLFDAIAEVLAVLRGIDSLMVELNLLVTPREALVEMWPAALPKQKTAASAGDTVPLYRGLYAYRVTKAGFKAIESTLNLVDEAGDTLACKLYSLQDAQGPYPCVFR
ncbi:MAG TPA: hypothetical protein VF121_01070 [Thermoanaerobaculia bacterium]|nr:hypothetical protein [Thermoanaerobaculia bacterium]